MTDIYSIVTDRILKELEEGTVPWHKPWALVNGGAFNRITGRRYSLLNQLLLKHEGEYASLAQWNKLGGHIRKGEKSEIVTFWKMPEEQQDSNLEKAAEEQKRKTPVLRYYRVFHISQVDGVESLDIPAVESVINPNDAAENIFQGYLDFEGIQLEQELSDRAYYSPQEDLIHLPLISQFESASEYYCTAFHEAVHSTGNINRLNRKSIQKVAFGSEEYSREELIAEIGSACMLSSLGINDDACLRNSAAYVGGWLTALKNDPRLIVSAASQAEKAVKYILSTYMPQFD